MYKEQPWSIEDKTNIKEKTEKKKPGRKAQDLSGKVFGRLTVIKRAEDHVCPNGSKKVAFLCKCSCGNQVIVRGDLLREGRVISCGCAKKDHANRMRALKSKKDAKSKTKKISNTVVTIENIEERIQKEVQRRLRAEKLKKKSFKINLFGWKIVFRKNK